MQIKMMQTLQKTRVRSAAHVFVSATGCLLAGLSTVGAAHAQTVNFSGVTLAAVSSAVGQNFATTSGAVVNVHLLSGAVAAVAPGASPDTTGFDASQTSADLTPYTFRFTFSTPQIYQITQNESLTSYETNAFTMPSGTWNVLSSSNATVTSTGSQVSFLGTTNNPPYGNYVIRGAGPSFDFTVTDSAGLQNYGSAISLNLQGSATAPEPGSIALFALGMVSGLPALGAIARRRTAH